VVDPHSIATVPPEKSNPDELGWGGAMRSYPLGGIVVELKFLLVAASSVPWSWSEVSSDPLLVYVAHC
jgi:hypothetical protein